MKKLFILLFIFLAIPLTASAKVIKVQAITPFDSNNPPHNFSIRLKDNIINEDVSFYKGMVMSGYIYQTIPPKRLKQDASFIFIPTKYVDFHIYLLKDQIKFLHFLLQFLPLAALQ